MKKIYTFALILMGAVLMTACVKDNVADKPEPVDPSQPVADYSKLKLNELYGAAATDSEKAIELYNTGDVDLSLEGVVIYKDEAPAWTGEAGKTIKAKSVFAIVGAKGSTPDGFSSGFSAKKSVFVQLFDKAPEEGGVELDHFQRGEKGDGWGNTSLSSPSGSWSRIPDGTGAWKMTATVTIGELNAAEGEEDKDIIQ